MIQENRDNYFSSGHYDHFGRWASYFYQIKNVINTKPKSILEIGVGNGTTSNYLKSQGYVVITADIAPDLNPDVVADITSLPFGDCAFDTIVACEILEHMPFEDSVKALEELYRVSKNYTIVSIPDHRRQPFSIKLKLPLLEEEYFDIRLPNFESKPSNPTHFWEIGRPEYPLIRIREIVKNIGFTIERDFTIPENPLVHFFILKK